MVAAVGRGDAWADFEVVRVRLSFVFCAETLAGAPAESARCLKCKLCFQMTVCYAADSPSPPPMGGGG